MSLAYLGEMGIVFNLAYIELKKARYLDYIKSHINHTKKQIEIITTGDYLSAHEMARLNVKLEEMLDKSKAKRKEAWVEYANGKDDANHPDFFSGTVYDFFEEEKDKRIAECLVVATSLAMLAMTLISNLDSLAYINSVHATWNVLFSVVFVSNLAPLVFIILGRMMKAKACACTTSILNKYTEITENAINKAVQP